VKVKEKIIKKFYEMLLERLDVYGIYLIMLGGK